LCFVTVLCVSFKFVDHGSRRGDTAHALNQWRHPVASSEALDVLHWVICPASYRRIRMAIEIASDSSAFFVVVDLLLPTTIAKLHSNS
jgi:hypothetical protein